MIVPPRRERVVVDGSGSIVGSRPGRTSPVWRLYAPLKSSVRGVSGLAAVASTGVIYSPPEASAAPGLAAYGALTNHNKNPLMGGTYDGSGRAQGYTNIQTVLAQDGTRAQDTTTAGLVHGTGQRLTREYDAGSEYAVGVEMLDNSAGYGPYTDYFCRVRFYVHSFSNDGLVSPQNRVALSVWTQNGAAIVDTAVTSVTLTATGWHELIITQSGGSSFSGHRLDIYADRGAVDFTVDTLDFFGGTSTHRPHFSGDDGGASWSGTAYASTSTNAAIDLQYNKSLVNVARGHIGAEFYLHDLPGSSVKIIDGPVDISINGGTIIATADGSTNVTATDVVADAWHHVALVWDGDAGTQYLYLDGYLADSDSFSAPGSHSDHIQVGSATGGGSELSGYVRNLTAGPMVIDAESVGALYSGADFIRGKIANIILSRNASDWSGSQPISAGAFNVVYTGGSVVNSATATAGNGFRERIGRFMDAIWPGATLTHVNLSTGGSTSFWRLQKISEIASYNPRIVIIDNVNDDDSHVAWEESGEAVLRRLRAECPNAFIVGIWPYRPNDLISDFAQYNQPVVDRWSSVCDELGISYHDFAAYMEALVTGGTYAVGDVLSDSVHPNDFGYELMYTKLASIFAPFVSPSLIPAQWTGNIGDYAYIGTEADVVDMMRNPFNKLGSSCTQGGGTWSTKSGNFESVAPTTTDADAYLEFTASGRYFGGLFTDVTDVRVSLDGGADTLCVGREVLIDAGSYAKRTVRFKNRSAGGTFTVDRVLAI